MVVTLWREETLTGEEVAGVVGSPTLTRWNETTFTRIECPLISCTVLSGIRRIGAKWGPKIRLLRRELEILDNFTIEMSCVSVSRVYVQFFCSILNFFYNFRDLGDARNDGKALPPQLCPYGMVGEGFSHQY